MVDNLRFWFLFLCIAGVILFVGWKQPLRYRFMSTEEIYALENPLPPEAPLARSKENWIFDAKRRTPLDRDAYNPNGYLGPARPTVQGVQAYGR